MEAPRSTAPGLGLAVMVPAVVVLVVLLGSASRYGFHRDELYFMANADHPAWGYVDHPPLTPTLGWLSQQLFGDTLVGLRTLTAVAAAGIVIAAAGVCRELGGDRTACSLAAWATASTALVLAVGHMLTTPTVDVLVWTISILLLARIVRTGDARWFVLLGAVLGLGLLNKFTVLLAIAAFGGALLLTPQRRVLWSRWTIVGGGVALLIWSPHLWWQIDNGWPVFEFTAGIADEAVENRTLAIPFQVLFLGLPVAVVVVVGWWRQLRGRAVADQRFIAIGFVLVMVMVIASAGKPYYAAGALPALIAVAATQFTGSYRQHRAVFSSMIAINGLISVALVLPLLPVESAAGSLAAAVNPEPLEMIGWPEFVEQIAEQYALVDDGDGSAVILTANYGEAGAIDRFGGVHGLPHAYSAHNSYADFRIPTDVAGPVLVVGYHDPRAFLTDCRFLSSIVMPYEVDNEEQGAPVWRCEAPRQAWSELWPEIRHID